MFMRNTIWEFIFYQLYTWYNILVERYYHTLKCPQTDVSGKVFVVTGGNAGIGKDTARQLSLMNAKKVYITSRDQIRGQKAVDEIRQATGKDNVEMISLDLASFSSVQKAAEELKGREAKIDVLILNAGLGHTEPGSRSEDGYDLKYQSNHLGHHLFLELLLPRLRASVKPGQPARVVVTSSIGHYSASEKSLANMEISSTGMEQYYNTKMMNVLMTRYYSQRWSSDEVIINALDPGGVNTDFFEKFPLRDYIRPVAKALFRTLESGAATTVFVATHPSVAKVTGKYWANMRIAKPHRIGTDDKIAEKFMGISFEHIKVSKPILIRA